MLKFVILASIIAIAAAAPGVVVSPIIAHPVYPAPVVKTVVAPVATSHASIVQHHAPVVKTFVAPVPVVKTYHAAPIIAHPVVPVVKPIVHAPAVVYHG